MTAADIFDQSKKAVKQNSPEILTAFGISGVLVTAYFTGKGSFEACDMIRLDEANGAIEDRKARYVHRTKLVWKRYIPAGVSCVTTVVCVFGASKASNRRTAAAVTAYSLSEKAFSAYKEKVVEELGKGKEEKIRDSVVKDRVDGLDSKEVIVTGKGEVLCCELMTSRYFKSDMETLRKSQNDINAKINRELYVTLDEFYDLIGLPHTSKSDVLGWDSDKLMELIFSSTLSPNGEPCLAFDYNYAKPL